MNIEPVCHPGRFDIQNRHLTCFSCLQDRYFSFAGTKSSANELIQ